MAEIAEEILKKEISHDLTEETPGYWINFSENYGGIH